MPIDQTMNDDIRVRCDNCHRAADYSPNPFGPTEESARVAGWRIGRPYGVVESLCYCPVCVGTDEGFWERRTLTVAYQAGIDAGRSG